MADMTHGTITTVTGVGDCIEMDTRYALFVYRNISTGNVAYVLDTNDMSVGSPVVFDATGGGNYSLSKLSSTKAVIAYTAGGNAKACVLTVTGKTVAAGTPATYESSFSATHNNSVTLDDTHVAVMYRNPVNPWQTRAKRLTITGTSISAGAVNSIFSDSAKIFEEQPSIFLRALSSTSLVFAYRDTGTDDIYAQVATVSGDTITTPGAAAVMYDVASAADTYSITAISATKIFVVTANDDNDYYGTIAAISGTTITPGTQTFFETPGSAYAEVTASRNLSAAYSIYTYVDLNGSDTNLYVRLINVSGAAPSLDTTLIVNPGDPAGSSSLARMAILSPTKVVGSWFQNSTPTAVLITVTGNAIFYQGAAALAQKFTLPFSGVAPKGITLNKALGTVVIGANSNNVDPLVFSTNPYVTGTATDTNFPETTAITAVKWI